MVVDAFKIFCLHAIPGEIRILVESRGDVSDNILDKHWVFITIFRDEFLVDPLQQGVNFTAGRLFNQLDHVLDPEEFTEPYPDGDDAPLVVGAGVADLLGTGADGCHRDDHPHHEIHAAVVAGSDKLTAVFHQAFRFRLWGGLFDEVGEFDFDMGRFGAQLCPNLLQDAMERPEVDLFPDFIEDLDKAAHVRALEMVMEAHIHVDRCGDRLRPAGSVQHNEGVL